MDNNNKFRIGGLIKNKVHRSIPRCYASGKGGLEFLVLAGTMKPVFTNAGFAGFVVFVRRNGFIMTAKNFMHGTLGRNAEAHYQHQERC